MIHLYQIGNVAFHGHHTPFGSMATTSNITQPTMLWTEEVAWQTNDVFPPVRTVSLQVSVEGRHGWRHDQVHQRLTTLVGRPTSVIGYMLKGNETYCACQSPHSCVVWFENFGVLKGLAIGSRENELEVTIDFGSYWTPLNRYNWSWSNGIADTFLRNPIIYPYCEGMSRLPDAKMLFSDYSRDYQFVHKQYAHTLYHYDPEFWLDNVCRFPPQYPAVGMARSWHTPTYDTIYSDPTFWGAAMHSLYAFRNLPVSGEISIQVNRGDGLWGLKSETATCDLAQLDDDLGATGNTGLLMDDILYTGYMYARPGLIMRDGQFISNFRVRIDYGTQWPGYLSAGRNETIISAPDGCEVAWVHYFRRR